MQRVRDRAAVASRVQVAAGAFEAEFERGHAAAADGDRGFVVPPHRAVGRQNGIRLQQLRARGEERLEVAAADLLLAFEEELDVEREGAACREEGLRDLDGDDHRSLVVGYPAPVETPVAQLRAERIAQPALEGIGRLHVVMAVDEDRRRFRRAEPLAVDDRVPRRRDRADFDGAGLAQLRGDPVRCACHVVTMPRIGADTRDAREFDELVEYPVVARRQIFERCHPVSAVALRRSRVAWLWGRLPPSTSCISSISRETSGVATPTSAPSDTIGPSYASVSVRRLRMAMSRQVPLCVLAELRLNATISSSDRSATPRSASGAKACGSNPLKPSGVMSRALATRITSRATST